VRSLAGADDESIAVVVGTRSHSVRLRATAEGLGFSCTYPVGDGGAFCKHCVATAVGWNERSRTGDVPKAAPLADVGRVLAKRPPADLAAILTSHAERDERLRRRLFLEAAKDGLGEAEVAEHRRPLDQVIVPGEFVDWREAAAYAERVEEAAAALDDLMDRRPEAQVSVMSRDLSLPRSFLEIAKLYEERGDAGRALERAERGHAAFPDHPDDRLRVHLAETYAGAGRHDDARGAQKRGCSAHACLELGAARAKKRPEDALESHRSRIDALLERAVGRDHAEAVARLERARPPLVGGEGFEPS
jgi:uncharacterized Zn finger protein